MTIIELTHALEIHMIAREAAYARFLVDFDKTLLAEVSYHGAIIVKLIAQIEILEGSL